VHMVALPPPAPPSDPVPAMRSVLAALSSHATTWRLRAPGFHALRAALDAATIAAGGVLGPRDFAAALAQWAPAAFPGGAEGAWPFVVGMGLEHAPNIDGRDFAACVEALCAARTPPCPLTPINTTPNPTHTAGRWRRSRKASPEETKITNCVLFS
jgi:hypothetical protein